MGRIGRGKNSPHQVKVNKKVEIGEMENTTLTLSRSRRTPKPNPKYSNDSLVTLKKISSSASQCSSSNEDIDNESSDEKVQKNVEQRNTVANKKLIGTRKSMAGVATPNKPAQTAIAKTPSQVVTRGINKPSVNLVNKSSPSVSNKPSTSTINKSSPVATTSKPVGIKPTIGTRHTPLQTKPNAAKQSTSAPTNTPSSGNVVRKLNNVTIRKISPAKIEEMTKPATPTPPPVARVSRNRTVASASPASQTSSPVQNESKPVVPKILKPEKTETPPEKRVLRKRKAEDEDFDEIDASSEGEDDFEIEEDKPIRRGKPPVSKHRKVEPKQTSIQPASKLLQLMREGDAAKAANKTIASKIQIKTPPTQSPALKKKEPELEKPDPNEPTFTVVNINDILKKAPEVKPPPIKSPPNIIKNTSPTRLQQLQAKLTPIAKPQIMKNSNPANKTLQAALRQAQIAKQLKEAQIKAQLNKKNQMAVLAQLRKNSPPKPKPLLLESGNDELNDSDSNDSPEPETEQVRNFNRRKAIHSTILTDDFEAQIAASSVSKIAPTQNVITKPSTKPTATSTPLNHGTIRRLPVEGGNGKFRDSITKPVQRILNSTLGKNKVFQSPLLNEQDLSIGTRTSNNIRGKETKENSKIYTYASKQLQSNKTRLEALMNSNPKVVFENQGGTRVKKITCFETWYVINIPTTEAPTPKPQVTLSLISMGNSIKEIDLPSSDWTYRINLTKLTNASAITELYEGEVQDTSIKEADKGNYEPASIIFRRANINRDTNLQYDRAITFKNKSYFLNVDGKNVKLVGAPQFIHTLKEIETLIEIIEDISLENSTLEQIALPL